MTQEEYHRKMSQLIARCWADEGFKRRLLNDATATLQAEGEKLPPGLVFKAVENTDTVFHLVIPPKPTELSDEELTMVSGGACRGDALKNVGALKVGVKDPWSDIQGCDLSCGFCF